MIEQISFNVIISFISALAAIGAVFYSKRSNSIADKANETAEKANAISEESNRLAREALELSKKQALETFPHFELVSIVHDPNGFVQYTNEDGGREDYLNLNDVPKLYDWVKNSKHSLSFITHNGKEYLLINIIDKQDLFDKIHVYIGVLDLKYKNHRRDAKSFMIKKSRSILSNGTQIFLDEEDLPIPIKREEGIQTLSIRVAYAHSERDVASIMTDKFYGYKRTGEIIDFFDKPTEAKNIFNFKDSAFITLVEDNSNTTQIQTVHLKMNSIGRVFTEIDDDVLVQQTES